VKEVPKEITAPMLIAMGACPSGVQRFREVFGESVPFVPASVYEAERQQLGKYLASWILQVLDREEYERAVVQHNRTCTYAVDKRCNKSACLFAALCRLARQNLPKNRSRAA
jgi:hypothetical protein